MKVMNVDPNQQFLSLLDPYNVIYGGISDFKSPN